MVATLIPGRAPSAADWLDLVARAPTALVYGVRTTGICCRAACPARTPNRANVSLFDSREAAVLAGFRPCKRCWRGQPDTLHPVARARPSTASAPGCELPCGPGSGDQTAMLARPGATARIPPPTPDFPGKPTRQANFPDPS